MHGSHLSHGADTEAMRSQAQRMRDCAQRLAEVGHLIGGSVRGMGWVGADAESFRARWNSTSLVIFDVCAQIQLMGSALEDESDQQDVASDPDRSDSTSSASEHRAASPVGASFQVPPSDLTDAGDDRTVEEDDFSNRRGDGSVESRTITLPDGSKLKIGSDAGGAEVHSMSRSVELSGEIAGSKGSLSANVSVGEEFEAKVHADGSVTYTFTATNTYTVKGELDTKLVDGEVKIGEKVSSTYSVTVPPDTPFVEAVSINPFDPESISAGARVTLGDGVTATTSLKGTADVRGVDVGLGVDSSVATGHTTVVSRDAETGRLIMRTGPTDSESLLVTASVGVEDVSVEFGHKSTHTTQVLEHAEFAPDASGNAAYVDALRSGGYPEGPSAEGVVDRYTQTHTTAKSEHVTSLRLGDVLSYDRSTAAFSDELIIRDYPDGHREWAQLVLPHGGSAGNSVLVQGGDDRPTTWEMTLGDQRAHEISSRTEYYWGHEHSDGDLRITYTETELDQMAAHRGVYHGDPNHYANATDYLNSMVALESWGGAEYVLDSMWRDYNFLPLDAGNPEGTQVHTTPRAPGRLSDED